MKLLLFVLLALALPLSAREPAPIPPASVAVLYNSGQPESRDLALYYARQRQIPEDNLIGLPLSEADHMSREEFDTTLRKPLRRIVDERWTRAAEADQHFLQVLVSVRGVPFGIRRSPTPEGATPVKGPHQQQDEAAVDSELTLLLQDAFPIAGALRNPYFKSETPATRADIPGLLLTARIDGPSAATCKRMIDDALAVEQSGLWGRCYLDLAKKGGAYQLGEDWINGIGTQNHRSGIPTIIDCNRDTFVTNYPMRDASLYYGWYTPRRNGPLLDDEFRFKRGAVAVHLHSFSAAHLRNPIRHWCGPLLEKGAAATLGNVHEPFLQLTHHFDIFHDRLLRGHSLVEAAHMAMPVRSWQGVVLGDPLYRPFARFSDPDPDAEADADYQAIRDAWMNWPDDPGKRTTKLRTAASRRNSGTLYEALGLFLLQDGQPQVAAAFFSSAHRYFGHSADRLRVELHAVDLLRQSGRKAEAIQHLRKLQPEFADTPGASALNALLLILDPPAPPPAQPRTPPQKEAE